MTKYSSFRYFKTSPDIIRLAVMLYVRFPLSLRNVKDLVHEQGAHLSLPKLPLPPDVTGTNVIVFDATLLFKAMLSPVERCPASRCGRSILAPHLSDVSTHGSK